MGRCDRSRTNEGAHKQLWQGVIHLGYISRRSGKKQPPSLFIFPIPSGKMRGHEIEKRKILNPSALTITDRPYIDEKNHSNIRGVAFSTTPGKCIPDG